jgi:UDP-glucuronate decarboxylase
MMNGPDDFVGPVNIGNPDEFTILQLANMVIDMTGSKAKVVHKDLPVDDPKQRRPDITLAKEKLGWQPTTKLAQGLEKTIAWFKTLRWEEYRAPTPNY